VLLTVFLIGAIGGLLAGLLGVGGAVIQLPLLTTFAGLSLKEAAGLTVVQVVASSLVSWWAFRRERLVHLPLAMTMGAGAALGGLAGGAVSGYLPERALELVFLGAVLAALALLLLPPLDTPAPSDKMPHYNPLLAAGLGLLVGALAGLLGAGGGFLVVPLLLGVMRLPTRLAIGTAPVVVLLGGAAGFAGKLLGGQVEPRLAAALVLGASPCAYLGARLGQRLPPRVLRLMLGVLLALIAVRSVYLLVTPYLGATP
jgi:uncharacterized membrane protein YfcA